MNVLPRPQHFQPQLGEFYVTEGTPLRVRGALATSVLPHLVAQLERQIGLRLPLAQGEGDGITLEVASGPGPEAYELEVTEARVVVRSSHRQGLFYGCQTLCHALTVGQRRIPAGLVRDEPRFRWRGAHLDVGRHFFPVEFVKRFLDLMALHKLNVFHWHLTEDQGWRIAVDAFPRLTEVAAWRSQEGRRYGGFYTKREVREVVAYAAERCIEVVPEIEMPGHAVAALAAHPELSCTGGPFEVETQWGIFDDVYCAGNEATFEFLERVLDEVIELFPSRFVHIGGDECPKTRWKACARCQARKEREGLGDEHELQSWFVRRIGRHLARRGKTLIGWDEILEGGLAPGAVVMSWRGTEGGIAAARQGHDVVMSPIQACYFDYRQTERPGEPGATYAEPLALPTVYAYEPIPSELREAEARRILGVQGNLWTEWMPTPERVEYMAFPRLCALSEVAWSSPARDFQDFERRLAQHRRVLDRWEVAYCGSERLPTIETPRPSSARDSTHGLVLG
jgi:hexosaminidase